jgi:hypothetical protein
MLRFHGLDDAESSARGSPRFFRAHATPHVFCFRHRKMCADLVVEIGLELLLAEKRQQSA